MKTKEQQKEELFTHATVNWGITNDAVKERIWNYVASLQSDLLSINKDILTLNDDVLSLLGERNKYKEALEKALEQLNSNEKPLNRLANVFEIINGILNTPQP